LLPRPSLRLVLLVAPALLLGGCGTSSHEAELQRQLDEARAQAAEADAAKKKAEADAAMARNSAREAGLSDFYASSGSSSGDEDSPVNGESLPVTPATPEMAPNPGEASADVGSQSMPPA